METSLLVRLGHSIQGLHGTLHNGPGNRIAIWTQGCVHRCTTNCLNPLYLDPKSGFRYSANRVAAAILAAASEELSIEGLTVLGGEPFEQPEAVAEVCSVVREAGLSTMVYTGHVYESLKGSMTPGIQRLLSVTDLLTDGPFLPMLRDESLAWRGSSNQRLLCLTGRYTTEQLDSAFRLQGKGFSMSIGAGRISVSGLQSREAAHIVEQTVLGPVENAQK